MQAIENLINLINRKFFPKGGPTDESLFNNILAWTFFSTSIVIIVITIMKYSKIVIFTILAGAILLLLIYLLSSHFNKQRLGSIILVVTVNFISLPLLFFMLGAESGGISSLFILGIVFTIVLINGIALYILVPLEVIFYGLVYWFAYSHPKYVTRLPDTFRSSFMYMFIASILIGCIAKILFSEYQKENKRVNELLDQVRELSIKDPLTSVYNRRYMMEYLEEHMQKSKEEKTPLSIILFDIDRFKEINDTYGHVVGDEVLQKISQIFLRFCRKGDIVARYGGEEFLIILPDTDIEIAVKRAEEIRVSVNQELQITQIKGVDSTVRETKANLGKGAKIVMLEKLMTHGDQVAKSNMEINLNGEDSVAQIISRSVGKENSTQVFYPKAIGNTKCRAHVQCDSIIMDNAKISSIPAIAANHQDAQIIHEAAIGKINNDQLIKLQTFGMNEAQAEDVIIQGFLK